MTFKQFILLGPPGSKVQEHGVALSRRWHLPYVSMQTLLQEAVTQVSSLGCAIGPYLESGEPIPDALASKLLRKRLEQPDTMLQGWILEGFPRSVAQAQALHQLLSAVGQPAPTVVYLKAMTGLLINRLVDSENTDEPISTIRHRLKQHQAEVAPLLNYYQQQAQLTNVNASLSSSEVYQTLTELGDEATGAARFIQDESELDSLLAKEPFLVVDCIASWCGSCKLVTPLIDKLADAYRDRVNIMKIDFDANKQIHQRFGLKGMPAVMFFKNGELLETLTGVKPYQVYSAALTRFLD